MPRSWKCGQESRLRCCLAGSMARDVELPPDWAPAVWDIFCLMRTRLTESWYGRGPCRDGAGSLHRRDSRLTSSRSGISPHSGLGLTIEENTNRSGQQRSNSTMSCDLGRSFAEGRQRALDRIPESSDGANRFVHEGRPTLGGHAHRSRRRMP